jgi:hypothetical protein
MQVVVSVVDVPPPVAAISVAPATGTMAVVVLTTAPRVATFATSNPDLSSAANPASMPAKRALVLKPPVVTTVAVSALSSEAHLLTLGTVATAALPRVKTHVKTALVKVAAGKTVVVTTAMPLVQHHAARLGRATSLLAAPSSLVPAISNPTRRLAKALPNAAALAC